LLAYELDYFSQSITSLLLNNQIEAIREALVPSFPEDLSGFLVVNEAFEVGMQLD